MTGRCDVLVVTPFRRPDFRHAISPSHPFEEPWDSPAFSIAAACEQAGYTAGVLALQNVFTGFDPVGDLDRLRRILDGHPAAMVVFATDPLIASRSTATAYGMRVISELLDQQPNRPLTAAVGRLPTVAAKALLAEVVPLDLVLLGDAEPLIGEVCRLALTANRSLHEHPNVLTRSAAAAGRTAQPAPAADPHTLPTPAFHLAGESIAMLEQRRARAGAIAFSIRTSYGCRFACRFCAGVPHWRDYRTKDGPQIAREIDHLYGSLPGIARLAFLEDEIATNDIEHVKVFASVLADRGIRLDGLYTHARLLTDEAARLIAPVVDQVFLGLDNADPTILRGMGKAQSLGVVLQAVERARAAGLKTHLEWIIGSPEETTATLAANLHAIFALLASGAVESINSYVYCPHPGTEYAEHAAKHGITIHEPFHMLESGGFPAASTAHLTRNQIFTAYLMSQLVISEAHAAHVHRVRPPVREELSWLFEQIGNP